MNHITIELCAEDRARLDGILEALRGQAQPAPTEQPAAQEEKLPWEESKPAVTLEQLQALAQELLAPGSGKSAAVRKLIKSHAERISLIPQDKWSEVYDALTALKEG